MSLSLILEARLLTCRGGAHSYPLYFHFSRDRRLGLETQFPLPSKSSIDHNVSIFCAGRDLSRAVWDPGTQFLC